MSTILNRIVEQTAEDLSKRRKKVAMADFGGYELFEAPRRDFIAPLLADGISVIAEVKKASPSKGIIRHDFDAVDIALRYEDAGASCLSVLTDEPFFQGSLDYLQAIRKRVELPLLRKDFIIDPYQIAEARAHGADAFLLIMAVLSDAQLDELLHAGIEYGIPALVECYDEEEVNRMPWQRVKLFGVNNRDLRTFETNVHRGTELLQQSPDGVVRISESGLSSANDLGTLVKAGIDAALIGESLMREKDPGIALQQLLSETSRILEEA
jgi:indole-3-glycerol phosphate synthase